MGHWAGSLAKFAVAVLIVAACGSAPAHADRRVALVIGNGAYANSPRLPNPKNDAEDVAAALKRSGFETIVGLDLDKAGMEDATIRFARAAREADVAMFYYSGHAMQFAGINYLMPVDARLTDEADLRRMARVDDIVADVQQAKNLRILVLDSCRDNPLAEQLKRSIGRTRAAAVQHGLAKIDSPQGMIVAYATQAGRTAEDGQGRNSPYTTAFLKHIEAAAEIGTVFRRISADVYESTRREQLPELSLSLIGEFYLRGRPPNYLTIPTVFGPLPIVEGESAWGEVKNTSNPAVLEAFIRRFGDSFYSDLARTRLEELKKTQTAAVAPPVQPATPAPQDAVRWAVVGKEAILLGRYADWSAYSATLNGNKVCYALAKFVNSPTGTLNPPREPTYLFVSTRPVDNVKNQISIMSDYSFSNSDVVMEVGNTNYALHTQNRQAWIKNPVDEPRVVDALIHHSKVSIKSAPGAGARPSDNYSQEGLAQALRRIAQECR